MSNEQLAMSNKKNMLFLAFIIFFLSFFLLGMSWPSDEAVLIQNFGSNNNGTPVLGMVFAGDSNVLAAENGEIIFTRNSSDRASRLPSPLGSWTAVDHGDGLISIYSRFADGEVPATENAVEETFASNENNLQPSVAEGNPVRVAKQQPIAVSGVSGWSTQNGFYFQVYDRRERRWINPAILVTPYLENRPPIILSVEIRNAQGSIVQNRNLSQGQYTVFVSANTSSAPRGAIFAPQRIVCSVNGTEAGFLNFEAISARDGVLMVYRNGLVPAKQIYSRHPSFETANIFLSRGQATLEVLVQDVAGNTRSVINRLIVN